jgi:hypothetical protein
MSVEVTGKRDLEGVADKDRETLSIVEIEVYEPIKK